VGDDSVHADGQRESEPAVDFASMPVAAIRIAGQTVAAVNSAYEQLTGIRSEQIVGRTVAELIGSFVIADDLAMMNDATAVARAGRAGDLWCRVTEPNGTTRTVRVVWRRLPGGAESDRYVFLIPADLDARERELAERLAHAAAGFVRCVDEDEVLVRAAEALSAQRYTVTVLLIREGDPYLAYGPTRSPVSSASAASLVNATRVPRDVLTRFNPRFNERKAAFFQRPEDLVRAAYPGDAGAAIAAALPGRRTVQAPIFVTDRPYGALVVTDDRLTPVSVGTLEMYAQLVGAAIENVRLHDRAAQRLAELERLQGELVKRERLAALGEAAAVMAHEVRNPIAAILNAVALLERGSAVGTTTTELHRMLAEEAGRLEHLVSDLLALGRPLLPRLGETNLADVLNAVAATMKSRTEIHGCVLDVENAASRTACADPELVELAVANVIRNAAQASPQRGTVRARVHDDADGRVAITVDDEGPGFSEQATDRLFEPFFTTRATGTGVGLAVVRRVLDAQGARFVVGRNERGGARVTMSFTGWQARSPVAG
jgi:PAS domain S-box-containing protein